MLVLKFRLKDKPVVTQYDEMKCRPLNEKLSTNDGANKFRFNYCD